MAKLSLEQITLLSDPANIELTSEIYTIFSKKYNKELKKQGRFVKEFNPGDLCINRFKDGEPNISINTNVRERKVYVIKSAYAVEEKYEPKEETPKLKFDPARAYEELFVINDALKRASAKDITNVMFYMPYLRQDRKDRPRRPITAKRYAQLTENSGAKRILTLEPHFKQAPGFYEIPFDDLKSSILFAEYLERKFPNLKKDFVVASPDLGGGERAEELAKYLGLPVVIGYKRRDPVTGKIELKGVLKMSDVDLKGKNIIIFDDIIDSGGSIIKSAENLWAEGAANIYACCAHPVLSQNAKQNLKEAGINIIASNSIPIFDKEKYDNIEIISLAPMGATAFYGIITGEGLTENLFVYDNYKKIVQNSL